MTGKFQPEYAGKLNFYIALVDDRLRRESHADTVGILICGSKNEHTVRYTLARPPRPWPSPPTPMTPCPAGPAKNCPTPTGSPRHWIGRPTI